MDYYQTVLPIELKNLLDQEIDNEEKLQWSAQPNVSRAVIKAIPLAIFGVAFFIAPSFIAFDIFKDVQAGKDIPILPLIFIGVFLLVGLFVMLSPYWAVKKAKNTVYAITDKRAVMITKKRMIDVRSFGPDKLQGIIKRIRGDGSGDLIFERNVSYHRGSKGGTRRKVTEIGFFGIPQVNEVEDLLKQIRQG